MKMQVSDITVNGSMYLLDTFLASNQKAPGSHKKDDKVLIYYL